MSFDVGRDRLVIILDIAFELLDSIKDAVGATNKDSLVWNRLVDACFIVACTPEFRQQVLVVPDAVAAAGFVACAYGLTSNGMSSSSEQVKYPASLIYVLCCQEPLCAMYEASDIACVTNMLLDFVLTNLEDARYSFLDTADNMAISHGDSRG